MKNTKTVNVERFEQKLKEIEQNVFELRATIDRKKQELDLLFAKMDTLTQVHEEAIKLFDYGKDYTDEK